MGLVTAGLKSRGVHSWQKSGACYHERASTTVRMTYHVVWKLLVWELAWEIEDIT
jgi:hypothetical protein